MAINWLPKSQLPERFKGSPQNGGLWIAQRRYRQTDPFRRRKQPVADHVDHTRIKLIRRKVDEWTQELIDLGHRNKLLNFKPTKSTSLDLGDCESTSLFALFQGRKVGLQSLFPDEAPRQDATTRARSLRRKIREFSEEQGVEVGRIAYGLVVTTARRCAMCWEYDVEYYLRRAEEARRAMREAEDKLKQAKQPAAPAAPVAAPGTKEPVPA